MQTSLVCLYPLCQLPEVAWREHILRLTWSNRRFPPQMSDMACEQRVLHWHWHRRGPNHHTQLQATLVFLPGIRQDLGRLYDTQHHCIGTDQNVTTNNTGFLPAAPSAEYSSESNFIQSALTHMYVCQSMAAGGVLQNKMLGCHSYATKHTG